MVGRFVARFPERQVISDALHAGTSFERALWPRLQRPSEFGLDLGSRRAWLFLDLSDTSVE
jgi:hypothetical protein